MEAMATWNEIKGNMRQLAERLNFQPISCDQCPLIGPGCLVVDRNQEGQFIVGNRCFKVLELKYCHGLGKQKQEIYSSFFENSSELVV